MQEDKIQKLNTRAKKSLTLKEVWLNDVNFKKMTDYLLHQKLLNFTEINKILYSNNDKNFPIGNIIEDNNEKVVGFMGTFYSKNKKQNTFHTLCNIHSWIVNKEHRNNSFFLLSPLLDKDIKFTAFTPIKSLVGVLLKFSFNKQSFYSRTILNLNYFNISDDSFFLNSDLEYISKKLNSDDLEKLKKYNKSPYIKFIINNKNHSDYIFVIGSIIKKKGLNVLNLFYISNPKKFKDNWYLIKSIITKKINVRIFSEYSFVSNESFFPKNLILSKKSKKDFFLKGKVNLDSEDLLNSDLII